MARDAYVLHSHKVVVFWSHKAGNTSLGKWLAATQGITRERLDDPSERQRLKSEGFWIDSLTALDLVQREQFTDFILARNPYTRAVSTYLEKFLYHRFQPLDQLRFLTRFAQRTYLDAMAMHGRAADTAHRYLGLSFVEFLQYVNAQIADHAQRGEPKLNGHWNTQVPFSFEHRHDYANIIRLERLRDDVAPLAQRLGITTPFPHSRPNLLMKPTANGATDLSHVRSVALIRANIVPDRSALLSDEARTLIRQAYEIDFRKLGYDPHDIPTVRESNAGAHVLPSLSARCWCMRHAPHRAALRSHGAVAGAGVGSPTPAVRDRASS